MKSTVERLSPTRVRINVEVPFDELKPDFDRAYKKIAQQVNVPGFRKGKVPARIIEARLGRGVVLEQVVNDAIPTKYSEAVTSAEDVSPLGQPEIEVTEIADNERLAFTAEVDVRPEIDAAGAVVARGRRSTTSAVTDADVDEALDNLRARFATLTGVERAAAKDDFVQIDLAASVDGEAVEEAQTSGLSYQVGQGGLIDGIDDAITGLSAGESATFPTTLVAGEYKDREAEVTVTVTAVKERELPGRRRRVRAAGQRVRHAGRAHRRPAHPARPVRQMEQLTEARDKVLDALVDATEVPLPEGILKQPRSSRGCTTPSTRSTTTRRSSPSSSRRTARPARSSTPRRARTPRSRCACGSCSTSWPTTRRSRSARTELTERIVFQAQQYQMPPEEFVQRIQEAGQLGAIYADVRRSKALIAAVRAATVTDASGTALDMAELLGDDEPEQADEAGPRSRPRSPTRRLWTPERTPTANTAADPAGGELAPRRVGSVQTEQTRARGRVK